MKQNTKATFDHNHFNTFIFDLDGTLLDTLPDLVELTNTTLREYNFPVRTTEEIQSFVGDGARALIRRALPKTASEEDVLAVLNRWQELYPTVGIALTRPYPGVVETLHELKQRGVNLGILSNKFDAGVEAAVNRYMPNIFDAVHGESENYPRKPDPAGLLRMMDEMNVNPDHTLYVGDSSGDITTAHQADLFALGVTWGYHDGESLKEAGADAIINDAAELLDFAQL